jgi:predicted DNA-binding transcriptional regulator AlpA
MNEATTARRYLAPKDAAAYLSLSVWSLYRLVERRAIPFIPLRPSADGSHAQGRASLRFDVAALDAWMRKQTVRPVSEAIDPRSGELLR